MKRNWILGKTRGDQTENVPSKKPLSNYELQQNSQNKDDDGVFKRPKTPTLPLDLKTRRRFESSAVENANNICEVTTVQEQFSRGISTPTANNVNNSENDINNSKNNKTHSANKKNNSVNNFNNSGNHLGSTIKGPGHKIIRNKDIEQAKPLNENNNYDKPSREVIETNTSNCGLDQNYGERIISEEEYTEFIRLKKFFGTNTGQESSDDSVIDNKKTSGIGPDVINNIVNISDEYKTFLFTFMKKIKRIFDISKNKQTNPVIFGFRKMKRQKILKIVEDIAVLLMIDEHLLENLEDSDLSDNDNVVKSKGNQNVDSNTIQQDEQNRCPEDNITRSQNSNEINAKIQTRREQMTLPHQGNNNNIQERNNVPTHKCPNTQNIANQSDPRPNRGPYAPYSQQNTSFPYLQIKNKQVEQLVGHQLLGHQQLSNQQIGHQQLGQQQFGHQQFNHHQFGNQHVGQQQVIRHQVEHHRPSVESQNIQRLMQYRHSQQYRPQAPQMIRPDTIHADAEHPETQQMPPDNWHMCSNRPEQHYHQCTQHQDQRYYNYYQQ